MMGSKIPETGKSGRSSPAWTPFIVRVHGWAPGISDMVPHPIIKRRRSRRGSKGVPCALLEGSVYVELGLRPTDRRCRHVRCAC
ncbi:hypothetical protein PUNSTDRAFT_119121 [Punctularia strigosozonata HHB-11173 SS5]|uniref:uncharacterized protein n=1 Tax=Punctularia strigosozonata (strain HHB-11173) TaxID=741275 RepID=UPI00044181F7|nr:uncharacterized protein PUNSTDRAFT_119121 [Punctularia strigosozonata HHB-11173 SS5]EIN11923.1 hypothetical protein PUNSTDRAFT_119121 [Punctularia strigosozonata HHB-11173 SS5]